jgi:hypothetical protein
VAQKQVKDDLDAKLQKANQEMEKLRNMKQEVALKVPVENNLSSVGQDKSHMESQGDAGRNLLAES